MSAIGLCQDCDLVHADHSRTVIAVAGILLLLALAGLAVRETLFGLAKALVAAVAAVVAFGVGVAAAQQLATAAGHAPGVLLAAIIGGFVVAGAAVGGLLFAIVGWRERRWHAMQLASGGDASSGDASSGSDRRVAWFQHLAGVLTEKLKMLVSIGQLTVVVLDKSNFGIMFPQEYKRFASFVLAPLSADIFDLVSCICDHRSVHGVAARLP